MREARGGGELPQSVRVRARRKEGRPADHPFERGGRARWPFNIKNVSRDDVLVAHRVPPRLKGLVPSNSGALVRRYRQLRSSRATSWSRCRPSSWKSTNGLVRRWSGLSPTSSLARATSKPPPHPSSPAHAGHFFGHLLALFAAPSARLHGQRFVQTWSRPPRSRAARPRGR